MWGSTAAAKIPSARSPPRCANAALSFKPWERSCLSERMSAELGEQRRPQRVQRFASSWSLATSLTPALARA